MHIKSGHFYIDKYHTNVAVVVEGPNGMKLNVSLPPSVAAQIAAICSRHVHAILNSAAEVTPEEYTDAAADQVNQFAPQSVLEHIGSVSNAQRKDRP